jgi:excisionase family DNA binding protein
MSTTKQSDVLLTPHQVADRLKVSKATVDRWMREGKIPCVPHMLGRGPGRRIYFSWPAVAKALDLKK